MTNSSRHGRASALDGPPGIALDQDRERLASYRSDADVPDGCLPAAILKPRSTEELEQVVNWARTRGVGLIPVSSCGPRRHGDTVPDRERCVIVDLSLMNKIINVDRRDKIMVVEPGVRFGEVDAHLATHGLRAFRPLAPRAGKSLMASYLEREPLISPNHHWDTADPCGGTGLVLGTGRYMPTGGGAAFGTITEQLAKGQRQMVASGPANLDLLRVVQGAQGSLAIMSWAAVYCERIPTVEQGWFASAQELTPLVNLARHILFRRMGNALFIMDRVQLALFIAQGRAEFDALVRTLPPWILFTRLYAGSHGTDGKMAWQQNQLAGLAAECGVSLRRDLDGYEADQFGRQLHRCEQGSFRDRLTGAHRELFFLSQLNQAEKFVGVVRQQLSEGGAGDGPLGIYLQPTIQGVSSHVEFTVPFDPQQVNEQKRLDVALGKAAARCAQSGAFFSRPYHEWSSLAFSKTTTGPVLAMTKSILDPDGVMNPGRIPYGV